MDLNSLDLLHYYSISDSLTLSGKHKNAVLWPNAISQLAIEYTFVMHGFLAVSDLHSGALRPERQKELGTMASRHEIRAPSFRLHRVENRGVEFSCNIYLLWPSFTLYIGLFLRDL